MNSLPGRDPDLAADAFALALDQALARALTAPAPPPGLQAAVLTALHREALALLASQRDALVAEHVRERDRLRRSHRRARIETLALVALAAFTAGALLTATLPWLRAQLGEDTALALPLVAVVAGFALGVSVWLERLGRPALP